MESMVAAVSQFDNDMRSARVTTCVEPRDKLREQETVIQFDVSDATIESYDVEGLLRLAVRQFEFDRVTGRPIWPIEERPVPQSTVPGEQTSRTQPFPTKPAPFDRQGVTEHDVIDFTPEHVHDPGLGVERRTRPAWDALQRLHR